MRAHTHTQNLDYVRVIMKASDLHLVSRRLRRADVCGFVLKVADSRPPREPVCAVQGRRKEKINAPVYVTWQEESFIIQAFSSHLVG